MVQNDTGLLTGLGETTQYNDGATTSISRSTDCGSIIVSQTPSAGSTNLPPVCINEIDPDQTGTDMAEFVEISGPPNTSLDGLVIVLFNGSDDASYNAFDLDGQTLDANGFYVLNLPSNGLQNGADAVAIYVGDDTDFPNDTPVTTTNLISAIVYGTILVC